MANIFVIDDDPSNREILRARLELQGHHVEEADNGEAGLQMIARLGNPDLVLLDVMMPRLDGWQVCSRMKRNPKTKEIPIIMLTAMGQQIDQLRGFESGADDYLTKPWNFDDLNKALSKYLTKKV